MSSPARRCTVRVTLQSRQRNSWPHSLHNKYGAYPLRLMSTITCSPAAKVCCIADLSGALKMTKPLSSFSARSFRRSMTSASGSGRASTRLVMRSNAYLPRAPPLVEALARGKVAVQDGDALAEALLEPRGEHRRERDLRHEQQRLLSPPHRLTHHLDVHLGLAAAGDALEEKRRERAELL